MFDVWVRMVWRIGRRSWPPSMSSRPPDDKVAALPLDALTHPELLALMDRREALSRRQRSAGPRGYRPAGRRSLAGRSWVPRRWPRCWRRGCGSARVRRAGVSTRRRVLRAATAVTGEPLAPRLPHVAAAQARGQIGRRTSAGSSSSSSRAARARGRSDPRAQVEADSGRIAAGLGPEELRQAADRLALLLNQDGDAPTDAERARRRYLTVGRQGADGMSKISGLLDPEARATLDAVLAKWAAPGMCNPDDQSPCVDGEPDAQAERGRPAVPAAAQPRCAESHGPRDARVGTVGSAQRVAGHHRRVHHTQESTVRARSGRHRRRHPAADGRRDPARQPRASLSGDLRPAHQDPLYLGRTQRIASAGQRIVLHAKDRGCTSPGCTVPGYGCQVHHAQADWANGGQSNIDDEALACGQHNRLVDRGRLAHPKTQRRPHRMDPPTPPGHWPNPSQRLPPPPELSASR